MLELSPLLDQVEAVQDRERMSCRKTPRGTVPENFDLPLFLHIEEGHKEPISGYLRCTAPPTFSITTVGPPEVRKWVSAQELGPLQAGHRPGDAAVRLEAAPDPG